MFKRRLAVQGQVVVLPEGPGPGGGHHQATEPEFANKLLRVEFAEEGAVGAGPTRAFFELVANSVVCNTAVANDDGVAGLFVTNEVRIERGRGREVCFN
jgi:hypothetical protein